MTASAVTRRSRLYSTALLLLIVLIALLANWRLAAQGRGTMTLLAFGAAGVLLVAWLLAEQPVAASQLTASGGDGAPSAAGSGSRISLRLVAASLLLGMAAFLTMGDTAARLDPLMLLGMCLENRLPDGWHQFTWLNTTCWLASIGLILVACWERGTGGASPVGRPPVPRWLGASGLRVSWTGLALAGVLVLGAALLFFRIGDVPLEMTSDHAEKLLDTQTILDGQRPIYFPCNTGREALQFYLIAVMAPLTGADYLTMKLGTALLAWLALPFAFLFARVYFGPHVALLATLLMASSRWLWQVARVGLRFPFSPLFGAAIFYFLMRALRSRRRNDFLLCGVVLGVAQHSYTALRFAPLAVAACVGIAAMTDFWHGRAARARRLLWHTVLLALVAFLVFLPLARYAFDQPDVFLFRGVSRVASDYRNGAPPHLWFVFVDNVKNAYLQFNWKGDLVWVNNISGLRLLDPVGGALLVLGCTYNLYRLVRYREPVHGYLQILLFMSLLPSMLSLAYPLENPSTVRSGMAIPVVAVLMALPLEVVLRQVKEAVQALGETTGRAAAGIAGTALIGPMLVANVHDYFRTYAAQHAHSSQHSSEVAAIVSGFLALGGERRDVHVLPGAYWFDTRLLAIQAGDIRWRPGIQSVEDAPRDDGVTRERMFVVHPNDVATLDLLHRWYPNGLAQTHFSREAGGEQWFVTVRVPPGTVAGH